MFQFRRFPAYAYLIQRTLHGYCPCGLPHSEISGSMDICSSPKLIAACHVLRRLLMPRHSPCALYSLTYSNYLFRSVLLVELCRLFTDSKLSLLPSSFQMLFHNYFLASFKLSPERPLCCLTCLSSYIVQFSRCSAPTSFDVRSQSPVPWALRSSLKAVLVGPSGLEPPTLRLSVVRSSQLSYGPIHFWWR